MPKALRDFKGYKFYFWNNEMSGDNTEPIYVHVSKGKPVENSLKIWVTTSGVEIDKKSIEQSDIKESELKLIVRYVDINKNDIIISWLKHFNLA